MREKRVVAGPWLLTQLAGLLLFLSWLLPPTAGLWQALDEATFGWLNGSLRHDSLASHFWAWLNVRAADLVPAVLMYTLGVIAAGSMPYHQRMRFIHRGLAMVLVVVFVITTDKMIEFGELSYQRASPSLVMDDVVRLSQVVPAAKDDSPHSFPGDHGYVLICVAVFFALASAPQYALMAVGIAIFFSLPRLISGAHWLSDILVGSTVKAVLTTGWLFATPLWDRLATGIERGLCRLPMNPVAWGCRLWWGQPPPDSAVDLAADARPTSRAA